MIEQTSIIRRKPEKVLEIDETVTKIIIKTPVQGVKIEIESTGKRYIIQRTIKNGLQMIGA
jgi:hypothetical protein